MVEPDRSLTTLWCMQVACCITKATDTHSEYAILFAFPQQQWLHEFALPVMFKIQQGNKGMLPFSVTVFCILFITETGMNVQKPFETSTVCTY
jgi:hypothetical protein